MRYYKCTMTETATFVVRARSEEEAQEWIMTHCIDDVKKETESVEMEYEEEVCERVKKSGVTGSVDATKEG